MNNRLAFLGLLLLSALAMGPSGSAVEPYHVGSQVAEFTARNQRGQDFTFQPGIRYLLISFDMATGKQANAKLSPLGKDFLPQHEAVYIANIFGMPSIGRVFALPKMRSYNHRIVLADAQGLLDAFPKQEGRVSVIALDPKGRISDVRYWNPGTEPAEQLFPSTPR